MQNLSMTEKSASSQKQLPNVVAEDTLDLRKLLIQVIVGLILLMTALALIGYFLHQPVEKLAKFLIAQYGGFVVMLGFMLPDALALPIPNDVFSILGLRGGLSFGVVVIWASAGTLIGGAIGYWIGRWLGTHRRMIKFFEGRGAKAYTLTRQYGLWALAIAAFTPFPYSIVCWSAGAVKIPFRHFLLVSLLRVPRVALWLWLMNMGYISMTQQII
jgi:membrane protein YqaA with SNARE-associated domain